jgi:hypothetical protein
MSRPLWIALLLIALAIPARAATPVPADFKPDPYSVQRHDAGYRYPQAGWIVVHIEGEPYERGFQHGKLLAPEIAGYVRCLAALSSPKAPEDGWKLVRRTVNALFLRRFDKEYLEEMKGIADGATAAGARFDNRPIDLVDIAGLNLLPELDTLASALEATPTGLEGIRFPKSQPRAMPPAQQMHCSAFAATGPATADGKVVIGHITMYGLYPSLFFNVWLDVKPAKGRRVLMQTYPGGIQSGLDYYMNDAGLVVCETTIQQTHFAAEGQTIASRIRQALQYSENIDQAVTILKKANNGLYTNEWLLADTKTNEIAMFELGTGKSRLRRSSKGEWFGGTEGFYWGCNNTKDLEVRMETVPSTKDRPHNVVWRPSTRDQKWLELYQRHKGKIDASFGRLAFTTPPLAAYHSLDAKYTTTDLAKELKTWALYGPPLGKSWQPTDQEKQKYPEIRAMASNPWVILHTAAPAKPATELVAKDVPERFHGAVEKEDQEEKDRPIPTVPAWHGTILPKSEADTWLAAAFADYEKIVALEKTGTDAKSRSHVRERVALELFGQRSGYLAGVKALRDIPLAETRSDLSQAHWYRMAAGKGVCLLQALRQALGDDSFVDMMDAFGREHAGKEVTSAEFQAHVEKWAAKGGKEIGVPDFFATWLKQPALPRLRLAEVKMNAAGGGFVVEGVLLREGWPLPMKVEVVIETAGDEVQRTISLKSARTPFRIEMKAAPRRLVVDRRGDTPKANGAVYGVHSFFAELEETWIVYGTGDERAANQEAAENLQRAMLERGPNITLPIKTDKEVTEAELKAHHVLLIGRPDSNTVIERFRTSLPISFGSRSFTVGTEVYAHAGSAALAAAENPLNPRYSVVVIAGLSAEATLRAAPLLAGRENLKGEVVVAPHGAKPRSLVLPARDLVYVFGAK